MIQDVRIALRARELRESKIHVFVESFDTLLACFALQPHVAHEATRLRCLYATISYFADL